MGELELLHTLGYWVVSAKPDIAILSCRFIGKHSFWKTYLVPGNTNCFSMPVQTLALQPNCGLTVQRRRGGEVHSTHDSPMPLFFLISIFCSLFVMPLKIKEQLLNHRLRSVEFNIRMHDRLLTAEIIQNLLYIPLVYSQMCFFYIHCFWRKGNKWELCEYFYSDSCQPCLCFSHCTTPVTDTAAPQGGITELMPCHVADE